MFNPYDYDSILVKESIKQKRGNFFAKFILFLILGNWSTFREPETRSIILKNYQWWIMGRCFKLPDSYLNTTYDDMGTLWWYCHNHFDDHYHNSAGAIRNPEKEFMTNFRRILCRQICLNCKTYSMISILKRLELLTGGFFQIENRH